ncbi:MAG: NAD(P)-dependent oxidoreductase [Frankiales bacterium]|nr:NAD(P)-dependent oxidoreductase [Frankiales bacterium]
MIAVSGATGAIGGRVARRLADLGVEQRLIVRDATRAPALARATVGVATYGDADAMTKALEGVRTFFMVSAAEAVDRLDQHRTAINAAIAAGVERIVYLSFLGAGEHATFTLVQQHWATEEHLKASGLRWTMLRDSMYADFLPRMAGPDGVVRGPAGDGRASFVAQDDIADAAVAVLTADETKGVTDHDGSTYTLTGPEALSLAEATERLSRIAGRPFWFVNETLEEAWESRRTYGAPDWEVEGWISSYQAIAAGEIETLTDDVWTLTGRRPASLERVFLTHPELLKK